MDKIKQLIAKPLVTGIVGLVIGLIIGLPLLGWAVWPVKWKDADASFLRQDIKDQYLCMVVDSYRVNQDAALAAKRIDSLHVDLKTSPYLLDTLQKGGCNYPASDPAVMALKEALLAGTVVSPTPVAGETLAPLPTSTTKPASKSSALLLSLLCALFLIIGGVLVYIFFIKNRKPRAQSPVADHQADYFEQEDQVDSYVAPQKNAPVAAPVKTDGPVAHFMTTYVIGDDLYDDSFSIDAPSGEFLGECGVGISDTIGVGDPKKVTAFEVWLFDKNDIQTVTKVLMSSHAVNDPGIRQRLASKGEPVLVEPGQQVLLETATLQLEARVIEMVYGQGALPSGSFFERLTLEIAVWPK
jgi:hypothetical protein